MEFNQELEKEIEEAIERRSLGLREEIEEEDTEEEQSDRIGFDIDVINAYAEHTYPDSEEFAQGVIEASKYIGQFLSMINAGMDNETAIVVMSWLREDKLNRDNINGQIELAKQESIKIKRESL